MQCTALEFILCLFAWWHLCAGRVRMCAAPVRGCVRFHSYPRVHVCPCVLVCRYLCLYDAPQWAWARSGLQLSQLLCVDAGLPPANLRYVHVWSDTRDSGTYGALMSQGGCTLVRYGDALLPLE